MVVRIQDCLVKAIRTFISKFLFEHSHLQFGLTAHNQTKVREEKVHEQQVKDVV